MGCRLGLYWDETLYYYITNLQGDVIRIIDTAGATICTYTYDAWGRLLNSSTNQIFKANPIRYRGYYYDTETGLYYLGSRYYDPAVKRFINADGYASTGQGFIGCNMFVYCLNNGIRYVDTMGNLPDDKLLENAKKYKAGGNFIICGSKNNKSRRSRKSRRSGTYSSGINVSLAWGGGGYASAGWAVDLNGNVGLVFSGGGGGGTPSVGLSRYHTTTNANDIYDLGGFSMQTGGSIDLGISVGGEYTMFQDGESGEIYQGVTVSGGISLPALVIPVELHGEVGKSYVIGFNIKDAISKIGEWFDALF